MLCRLSSGRLIVVRFIGFQASLRTADAFLVVAKRRPEMRRLPARYFQAGLNQPVFKILGNHNVSTMYSIFQKTFVDRRRIKPFKAFQSGLFLPTYDRELNRLNTANSPHLSGILQRLKRYSDHLNIKFISKGCVY